mgnify:CR=1 FL=1
MKYFAHINSGNVVINVYTVSDADAPTEEAGVAFLKKTVKINNGTQLKECHKGPTGSWNDNTGIVAFSVSNGIFGDGINISGVQVTIDPTNGNGPFYTNSIGLPTDSLMETSENGGGQCGAVTIFTGPCKDLKACSVTWAHMSAAILQRGLDSSTTTKRPVFSTLSMIVSKSNGEVVLGSITSH